MGKKLGCSEATIRRWESGEREIPDDIIERLCESCNVDGRVFDVRLSDSTDPGDPGDHSNTGSTDSGNPGDHSTNGITGLDKHIAAYCNYVPDTRDVVDYQAIGERVRELRIEKGLTQKDFAEKAGCSSSVVLKIELNQTNATDKILHDISDAFDVGFEWLKFGDERHRKSPVNQKLIDWLIDHQEIRNQLWEKMLDEEQN